MSFKEELAKYQKIVNKELVKNVVKKDCVEKGLNDSIEYSLMAEGKRLRPSLMIATYTLFKEDYEKCLPFGIAMEMIHNFSLIHDDLPAIDNDDFRRGKLTNHKKFNECTAILAGDSLLNNAYIVISKAMLCVKNEDKDNMCRAFSEFTDAVNKMIIGEYVDTEFEGTKISNEYLEYIHNNKTGALICASIRIGAILAGANDEQIERLTQYAQKIGLTFQIKDDILSEIGDEKVLGKPVGNDKARGKCTYVTKYGLDEAKNKLEQLTNEAVNIAETYGENGQFFKELAIYFRDRNK